MEAAPLFHDIALGPEGGKAYWMLTTDGVQLRAGFWPGGDKGTVLILPGRTEFVERYGIVATQLAARGFNTLTLDYRGHGLSDRLTSPADRGHVDDFRDYQLDVAALMRLAKTLHLPEPFFLFANSMGGCIGLRALHEGLQVKAVCFNAPMWGIKMSPVERFAARAIGQLLQNTKLYHARVPTMPDTETIVSQPFEDNAVTRSEEIFRHLRFQMRERPELVTGSPSINWLHQALLECDRLTKLPLPDVPAVTFLGTDEQLVDTTPAQKIMKRWKTAKLITIPGGKHEVFLDLPDVQNAFYTELDALFSQNRAAG
ncbi:MAG: alpha/beta fold hydrolase [Marinosulfonomonas sp.]